MAAEPREFDEILKRFDKLSRDKREELIDRLEQRQTADANGGPPGRTLGDAFNERGMVGSIKDAPPDWSSNPKYMEGFGQDGE